MIDHFILLSFKAKMRPPSADGLRIVFATFVAICVCQTINCEKRWEAAVEDRLHVDSLDPMNLEIGGVDSSSAGETTESAMKIRSFMPSDADLTTEKQDTLGEDGQEIFSSPYNTTNEVDLVFAIDRSGSVPSKKWKAIVQFVKNVLQHFTVDRDNTRVAVVTYSTTVSVDFDDLEPKTDADEEMKCSVLQRLENILTRKLPRGYTATYDALVTVYKSLLNSRPSARKAVLVITDGKSNIGPPPLKAAVDILSLRWQDVWDAQLFGPQVEIFVFGVEEINMAELKSIASSLPNHVFIMSEFRHFEQFARKIRGDKQQDGWAMTEMSNCGGMCNGLRMACVCGTRVGLYACVCEEGYEMRIAYCRPCDLGYYKEDRSPDECRACPENMTTRNIASTSVSDCTLKPGYVVCPSLPDVEHATKFYVEGTTVDEVPDTGITCTRVTDGNSCHYACDVGYRLTGSPVMSCNYSGIWEGDIPSCRIIDCHRIEHFYEQWAGMTVNYVNHSTTYNSMVEVTCREGSVPSNWDTVWKCDSQGQWSSSWNFQCKEIYCGPLMHSRYVDISPEVCQKDRVALGTHCRMECSYGFEQSGPYDFLCMHENGTPQWSPDTAPVCRDVHQPKIVCPNNVDVMVSDWGQNSTIIYYDKHKPYVTDNSGEVTFEIRGAPEDKQFSIGNTVLVYEAVDEAGNRASCIRYVNVRGRSVVIKSCPSNLTATVTSHRRTSRVTWSDPVFIGPGETHLPFTCSTENGREFLFGFHSVICYPDSHPAISCEFHINITDPPCPIPFEDRAPLNGALICGTNSLYYPKICRIHCREGYEMHSRYDSKHKFVCQWNGTWNLEEDGWPECLKSRRSGKALVENQLHVRFAGACHEVQAKISDAFIHTIRKVLDNEQGPCPSNHLCKIEDIQVRCGSISKREIHSDPAEESIILTHEHDLPLPSRLRSRRGIAEHYSHHPTQDRNGNMFNATIKLHLSAEIKNRKDVVVTKTDQVHLLDTLDEIFDNISDLVAENRLKFTVGTSVVDVTSVHEIKRRFKAIRCTKTEIKEHDDLSTFCYSCGPGSFLINGSCELCPLGTYQPSEAGTRCHTCPTGTSTNAVGARALADCREPCPPGYFSESGLRNCKPCAAGTFQEAAGSSSCMKCPKERQTLSHGSVSIDACVELTDCYSHNLKCDGGFCFRRVADAAVECFCPSELSSCLGVSTSSPSSALCQNSGVHARLDDKHFGCQCPPEFTGEFCELKRKACSPSLCQNGGTCLDHISHFVCLCPLGYTGERCESLELELSHAVADSFCHELDSFGMCISRKTDASPDFDVVFNTSFSSSLHQIHWNVTKSLASFTTSLWLRGGISRSNRSTILSFRAPNAQVLSVDIVFRINSGVKLQKEESASRTFVTVLLQRGVWHHIVIDWSGLTGFWRFFLNDSFINEVHIPSTNEFLTIGSHLILGEAFEGEMSHFAFYDRLLPREEQTRSSESLYVGQCRSLKGNIIQWTDILQQLTHGSVLMTLRRGSWCLDVNECLYPFVHKCQLDEMCIDQNGSWSCLPCDQLSATGQYLPEPGCSLHCRNVHCKHNGTCGPDGKCICPPKLTGAFCETRIELLAPTCILNLCLNGGSCFQEGSSVACRCPENWTGKYCQVHYTPSCELNPCVNNGSCVVVNQPDRKHYKCLCPEFGHPLGANCEFLAICDTLPCLNGGTCVNLENQTRYQCMCSANYTGQNCESLLSTSPVAVEPFFNSPLAVASLDICHTVECHNGGTCFSMMNGFICKCQRDYKGQYCNEKRSTETKKFHVMLSLLREYDSRLHYDTSFQENFKVQIHQLFAKVTVDSKLYVVINDIRKGYSDNGDVLMDFTLIFTFYLDSVVLGSEAIRAMLVEHLLQRMLGTIPASFEHFHFEVVPSSAGSSEIITDHGATLYVMIIVLIIATVICFFVLFWRRRNKLLRTREIVTPFHQILNNLQQHISKPGKLPFGNRENDKNTEREDSNDIISGLKCHNQDSNNASLKY